MKKRVLSFLLCVVLMAGLMSTLAFADNISEASFIVETPYGGKEARPIAYIALEIKEPVAGI